MYKPSGKLSVPTDFGFPYEPYEIQSKLMASLFNVLEEKKIGIFESPTGTGKSLTLTCASLCWLEQHEMLVRRELQERIIQVQRELNELDAESDKCTDWLTTQHTARIQRDELKTLQSIKELLEAYENQLIELRKRQNKEQKQKRRRDLQNQRKEYELGKIADEEDLELNEETTTIDTTSDTEESTIDSKDEKRFRSVQVFFCSRTHSQLAQVLREVKRTMYGKRMRCVSLASRQQLCINPQVRCLSNVAAINERCLDMARKGKSVTKATTIDEDGCVRKKSRSQKSIMKCSYKAALAVQELSETSLCDVLDIEELLEEAHSVKGCAYYAAREAAQYAQLIMLPYQMLLHRRTRLQSGIDIRGAVIIIDEAHNLLDTISQLYSCELSLQQLLLLSHQINAYKQEYASRFSTANLLCINQLLFVTKRLAALLQPSEGSKLQASTRMLRTYQLTAEGEFFNIDLYQLLQFCERTRFPQKLQGHAQRASRKPRPNENKPPMQGKAATVGILQRLQQQQELQKCKKKEKETPVNCESTTVFNDAQAQQPVAIRPLLAFLEALTENADDGRVVVNSNSTPETGSLKYVLLNPGSHFTDILNEARAIVIAGGTMQPTTELTQQLFHSCPERVTQHFYDHVVSADAVLPLTVSRGPTGQQLCFNFAQRGSAEMLTELSRCLLNFCSVIPDGVVCFLPSYEYLDAVYAYLQRSGMLARLSAKKCVFYESRILQNVEQLLADYAAAIKRAAGGALLLSVVGGKLSEGLNFADDLGRGVIVVGLPYPNRQSPELMERLKYLDATLGTGAGNEYYENLCMKAINQCIGRSVRHIRDYACVCLLDERYVVSERVRKKLPQWIARSLQPTVQSFGAMQASIAKFFKQKRLPT